MRTGLALGMGPGAAIGLGRFGYSLLLPAMQSALQLTLAQAGALGSANTGGYLVGAVISHK
ncbi:MAG: YbfB/YjiJ family MFS transporter, partial [Trueperaceae bacterium]